MQGLALMLGAKLLWFCTFLQFEHFVLGFYAISGGCREIMALYLNTLLYLQKLDGHPLKNIRKSQLIPKQKKQICWKIHIQNCISSGNCSFNCFLTFCLKKFALHFWEIEVKFFCSIQQSSTLKDFEVICSTPSMENS